MMNFKKWFESIHYNSEQVIVPKGETLYHGTIESFDNRKIDVGGYDEIFWTTDNIMIARSYIPSKSSYISCPIDKIINIQDKELDGLRKSIGLTTKIIDTTWKKYHDSYKQYDYWKKEHEKYKDVYEKNKNNLEFFDEDPDFFKKWMEAENNYKKTYKIRTPEDLLKSFVIQKMKSFGYELENSYYYRKLSFDEHGNLLPASKKNIGSVLKIICNRNFIFYNYAFEKEGDLTEPDYHKLDLFKKIELKKDKNGHYAYDGIIINDFAQSDYYGNMNHISLGFFKRSLNDVSVKKIRNQTHPYDDEWNN